MKFLKAFFFLFFFEIARKLGKASTRFDLYIFLHYEFLNYARINIYIYIFVYIITQKSAALFDLNFNNILYNKNSSYPFLVLLS